MVTTVDVGFRTGTAGPSTSRPMRVAAVGMTIFWLTAFLKAKQFIDPFTCSSKSSARNDKPRGEWLLLLALVSVQEQQVPPLRAPCGALRSG